MSVSPVRLAVIGAHDIVARGLASLAAEFPQRVTLVPWPTPPDGAEPDVVLVDAISLQHGERPELDLLVKETPAAVVVLARDLRPDLAARALARGAEGCVSLEADAAQILAVVEAAAAGQLAGERERPGGEAGLTPRELEMLGYIMQGFSNVEIAGKAYLSVNSVKTYVRGAYRKIGAHNRAQAVVWCLQHGITPGNS